MGRKAEASAIRQAYERDSTLRAIFDYLAERQKNASEWPVERAERAIADSGLIASRAEVVESFRKMDELGLGEFVVGRRTKPSRFRWHVPMIDAGRVAKGLSMDLPMVHDIDEETGEVMVINPTSDLETIYHSFNLRPDFVVSFQLPRDFSSREAVRLTEFIKMLPFD